MNIGELTATLGIDATGLQKANMYMRNFEQEANVSLGKVQRQLQTTGSAMKTFGRQMNQYVTLPTLLVGGAAFKMYKDFEFSMTKIISLVGVARTQVEEWGQDILRLAPTVGKSPQELAEGLFFITSAGIRGAEAMEILEASARGSATGLGQVKAVADLVTSAVNAYGKENLTASYATDILTAAVREGKVESEALSTTMGLVLPIASAMGSSFDQVAAATAAMTRTGTKAATAAIQLRQIFNSILKPAKEAEDALQAMGTSGQELRDIIREKGLLDALYKLDQLTKTYGQEALGKVIPNIRSLTGILDIMGKNVENNVKIFDRIHESIGDADKAFEEASKTIEVRFNKQVDAVRSQLILFGKNLAEYIIPLMEKLVRFIQKLGERWDYLTESQKRLRISILAVTAVLGPLLTIMGFLVGNVLPGLIMAIRGVASAFSLLNPVTAVIITLASVIGLATRAFAKQKKEIEEVTSAQQNLNDAYSEFNQLVSDNQTIKQRMEVLGSMNKRQLKQFLERIKTQKQLEEDYSVFLDEQASKQVKSTMSMVDAKTALIQEGLGERKMTEAEITDFVNMLGNRQVEIEKDTTNRRVALYDQYITTVEKQLKKLENSEVETASRTADSIRKALQQELSTINIQKQLGLLDDEGAFEAMAKAYDSAIRSMAMETGTVNEEMKKWAQTLIGIRTWLDAFQTDVLSVNDVMQDASKQLVVAAKLNEALGDSYDHTGAQISIYSNVLRELIEGDYPNAEEAIAKVIKTLQDLNNSIDDGVNFWDKYDQAIQVAGATVNSFFSSLSNLYSVYSTNELKYLEESLDKRLISQKQFEEKKFKIQQMYAEKQKRIAIAQALIDQSMAIVRIWREWSANPVVAGILTGLAVGTTGLQIAAIRAQKFAEGGIVPQGYPSDSYPALLTSGEAIVPAKKLNDGMGKLVVDDIVIDMQELRISLKQATELHNQTT